MSNPCRPTALRSQSWNSARTLTTRITDIGYRLLGRPIRRPGRTLTNAWTKTISLAGSCAAVLRLDLTELRRAYFGVGKRAFPPELMLMVVLYEMHSGQLHPGRWAKDCQFFDPIKWLAMGFEPSPAYFYSFRKRLGAHLRAGPIPKSGDRMY